MSKVELLLPAGNIEKMKYAISYGADAVYFGISDFSLRSARSGNIITLDNIREAIDTAHKMGSEAYVTINIFANNEDFDRLPSFLEVLGDAKPDGIIFGDPGIYNVLKREVPHLPMHVSTQANSLNYEAVKFWRDLGVQRVILARELSLKQIEEISSKVPDVELEVLIHGSMCVAYSGRCLLSDYMTENKRKANQGNCSQPCRWNYKLYEEARSGEMYDITEDERGTYILNPKDLALVEYVSDLINSGVHSMKVEGRTKSLYYASIVAKAYRQAIDAHYEGRKIDSSALLYELSQAGNRGFSKGFLYGTPDHTDNEYRTSKGVAGATFVASILEKVDDFTYKAVARNQLKVGDVVEWITPTQQIENKIQEIITEDNESVEAANTNDIIFLKLYNSDVSLQNWEYGIVRRKDKKDAIQTQADIYCGTCNGH